MRDARDAFEAAGQSAAPRIGDLLADPDVLAADTAAARRRRSRANGLRGTVAGIAIIAAGASALTLRPDPPLPAGSSADGVVREAAVLASPQSGVYWCEPSTSPEPYLPYGPRGVSIASDDARDADIQVDARLLRLSGDISDLEEVEFEQGDVVTDMSTSDEMSPQNMFVSLDVSWAGDDLYQVDGGVLLEASGRVISPLQGWPSDTENALWGFGASSQVPRYDPETDRSSISLLGFIQPACLGRMLVSSGTTDYAAPDMPVAFRTAVQVRAEDGEPLATFIDAAGLDGVSIDFAGYREEGDTVTLDVPTDEEIAAAQEERDSLPPALATPSYAAELRDLVIEEGVPLADAGAGIRLARSCTAEADLLTQEGEGFAVLPATTTEGSQSWMRDFPREVSLADLDGGQVWRSDDADATNEWGVTTARLYLVDAAGALRGQTPIDLEWTFDEIGGIDRIVSIQVQTGMGCSEIDDLTAGEYRALISNDQGGWDLFAAAQPVSGEALSLATAWYDLGAVTVTE